MQNSPAATLERQNEPCFAVCREQSRHRLTHLPCNALHHHSGHGGDGPTLRVVERALRVVQAGQRSDLLLGNGGLVWRLQEVQIKL